MRMVTAPIANASTRKNVAKPSTWSMRLNAVPGSQEPATARAIAASRETNAKIGRPRFCFGDVIASKIISSVPAAISNSSGEKRKSSAALGI